MHIYTLHKWQHDHNFTRIDPSNERKTLRVVLLTASMMGLEIIAGTFFGSVALLADGWHMGTHGPLVCCAKPDLSCWMGRSMAGWCHGYVQD